MKINGWDISNANAKQWNVTLGHHSVSNNSEWVRGSPVPAIFGNELGFKSLKIVFLVFGENREDILNNRSILLSHLIEPAELSLDGFLHKFYGVLTKITPEETVMRRWHKLTLEFNCYEYATQADGTPFSVSASGAQTITVSNQGNILTPAILEITPQIGTSAIRLSGICREPETGNDLPVTVRELTTGNTVILDGESGLITQNGEIKSADVDIWALPTLLPGSNTITVDSDRMDLTIKFRPRFM